MIRDPRPWTRDPRGDAALLAMAGRVLTRGLGTGRTIDEIRAVAGLPYPSAREAILREEEARG